jgi:MOSC domain-containing protein YiiM
MTGRIENIWIKTRHGGPMEPRASATLVAGEGISDNADQGGDRQVVIMDLQRWQRVQREAGNELDPIVRRGNVLLSGVPLNASLGRVLRLGPCRIRIMGESWPCDLMDPGLKDLLVPELGGGVHGIVLDGGSIQQGDTACFEDHP